MTRVSANLTRSATPSTTRRADALDALRGFAILTMALSGMIPHGMQPSWTDHLPAWMYHAQKPPPIHEFDPTLSGLTWVDLVFPFFLFSMGAAMPLAMARRLAKGTRAWHLAGYALRRGLLLLAFALYVEHLNPWLIDSSPGTRTWWLALLGFALLFPALARLPRTWNRAWIRAVRVLGWGGGFLLLGLIGYADGGGLSLDWHSFDAALQDINIIAGRSDIIIVVLAHTATVGALLWLISRRNWPLRITFMLVVTACILGAEQTGWVRQVWHHSPVRSLLLLGYLKYLLIVLPGTIVGDLLLAWLDNKPLTGPFSQDSAARRITGDAIEPASPRWSRARHATIALLMLGLCTLACVGLQARWLPWTTLAAFAACALGTRLFIRARAANEVLLRQLYGWGVLWLVIGLLLEPYEGGIRKDHATMSYYFVTSGLATFGLIFFAGVINLGGRRGLWLLIDSGKNPMIAYAGIRGLLPPVLGLTGLEAALTRWLATPWLGVLRGLIKATLLGLMTSVFTRLKVFWRT